MRRYVLEGLVLALLTGAILAPWGCSKTPLAPLTETQNTFALPNGVIAYPGELVAETQSVDSTSLPALTEVVVFEELGGATLIDLGTFSGDIASTGGTIVLPLNGDTSYFTVPTAALDRTTEIDVTVRCDLSSATSRFTEFEFAPDGLDFDLPAVLSFRSLLRDGEVVTLYWWDSRSGQWRKSADAVVVNGYASFPIAHFSKYGTKEKISLGGQKSSK